MKKALVLGMMALASQLAFASEARDDLKSCYDYAQITDMKPATPLRDIVVMVDQTVNLDTKLKKTVHRQVQQLVEPGDRIRIVSFSANAQGRYTDVTFDGQFDQTLAQDQRNAANRLALNKFDNCMAMQSTKAIELVHKQLKGSFHDSSQHYPKTELVGSLLTVSEDVFADIQSERTILILVSDMIENSDVSSFYSQGHVRPIDASQEFAKFADIIPQGALNNADVFVIGGGYVQGGKAYSSQAAMRSLESFWQQVIAQAGGQLVKFGAPQLLTDIQ
ncbi:hypothetical protein [Marinomonas ostreistagni]|uniref:hypothetical protein n=1 Tax=Marinomonas ostreistagni TaxID=359209 RepID=UPI00195091AB|nr:hypothetical protein [Marinomonas ostreistagni]MBM6551849.1 hypothetical protein [Marinomonas ostreistagni]